MQTLIKNWWLLALCGIFEAVYAAVNLFMQGADGSWAVRTFAVRSTVLRIGALALAAGACAILAGLRSSKRKSWLLVLNGLAFGALGLLLRFWTGPLAFRTIAFLIVVMAASAGILELTAARKLRRHAAAEWFLGLAGVVSVGFGLVFLAFVLGVGPKDAVTTFLWMGSYFGFSALCLLIAAARLNGLRADVHRLAVGGILPAA